MYPVLWQSLSKSRYWLGDPIIISSFKASKLSLSFMQPWCCQILSSKYNYYLYLVLLSVSIKSRSQLVGISDNDSNSEDNSLRQGSITDNARIHWWNNVTNDSTYQLDKAVLISDEGNGFIFSDIQIIVWSVGSGSLWSASSCLS